MDQEVKTPQIENLEADFSAAQVALPESGRVARFSPEDYLQKAGEWFELDVANGDARPDTIRTYLSHLNHWFCWCWTNHIDPGQPDAAGIKGYRQELVQKGAAHATISLKLTTIRRVYEGAVARGQLEHNPATKIKAPGTVRQQAKLSSACLPGRRNSSSGRSPMTTSSNP